MSFVTEIRILKYETPHVHVIISPTLVTVVEFDDDDSKRGSWTPHYDVEKPPATMTLAELEAVANHVLTDVGFKGPRRRLGPVTDGAGQSVDLDTTTPLGPPEDSLAARMERAGEKLIIAAYTATRTPSEADPGMESVRTGMATEPEPECEACGDKGYTAFYGDNGISATACSCPHGKAIDLRTVAAELEDQHDELGPAASSEEMARREKLAARVLQHVEMPVDKRPVEVAPVITVRGTDVFIDGEPATPEQVAEHATAIVKAAGVTLIGSNEDTSDIPEQDFTGGVRGKYTDAVDELRTRGGSKMNPLNNAPKKRVQQREVSRSAIEPNLPLPTHPGKPINGKWPMPKPDTKARGKVVIMRLLKITDSSVVDHVGYDPRTCTLQVGITKTMNVKRNAKSRATPKRIAIRYRFKDVPAEIFLGILTAKSAGTYFNEMVRPHYIGRRVP